MTVDLEQLSACTGFDWGAGNSEKNWAKHKVTRSECEQISFNLPFVVADDRKHSQDDPRFYALGHTDAGRMLSAVLTIRRGRIRLISTRDMNRAERRIYGEKEDSEVRE